MNSPPNHEWEEGLDIDDSDLTYLPPRLDIDDSDLQLTSFVRTSNNPHIVPEITTTTQTLFSSQNNQVDICVAKPIRIIPGPAGIVQTSKLRKLFDTHEGGEESVMSTQEYIRKVIKDVGEDDDFMRAPWLSAIDYVNVDEGIVTGCFRDVRNVSRMGNLRKLLQLSSLVLRMRWAISQQHSKIFLVQSLELRYCAQCLIIENEDFVKEIAVAYLLKTPT
ncbi:hypothetical protein Tco_1020969 [Tanacetum coccineum]